MTTPRSAADADTSPAAANANVFAQAAGWMLRAYDAATTAPAVNDTVKLALGSQRPRVDSTLATVAGYATKLTSAAAGAASRLTTGDRAFQPPPLPHWLCPAEPVVGVTGAVAAVAFYAAACYLHVRLPDAAATTGVTSSAYAHLPSFLTGDTDRSRSTDDPLLAGPMPGFEPRLMRMLLRAGLLPDASAAPPAAAPGAAPTAGAVTPLPPASRPETPGSARSTPTAEPLPATSSGGAARLTGGGASGDAADGFELVPDTPLGGTVRVRAPPGEVVVAAGAAAALATAVPAAVPAASAGGTTDAPRVPALHALLTRLCDTAALRRCAARVLAALHPRDLFRQTTDETAATTADGRTADAAAAASRSYHAACCVLYAACGGAAMLGLSEFATHRGVRAGQLAPSAARVALAWLPAYWSASAAARLGADAGDSVDALQFAACFALVGAALHAVPAVLDRLLPRQPIAAADLTAPSDTTDAAPPVAPAAAPAALGVGGSGAASWRALADQAALGCHLAALFVDANFALQLCVLAPALPPAVKLLPALHVLVARRVFLSDAAHVRSYHRSITRCVLVAGAARHFATLVEAAASTRADAGLAHTFPRLLSLALLPVHLAAMWMPLRPVRVYAPERGGLLASAVGFATGTAWSPGALAAANVAWIALYLSQGTAYLNVAQPRAATLGAGSSMPLPLFALGLEVLAGVSNIVAHA